MGMELLYEFGSTTEGSKLAKTSGGTWIRGNSTAWP